MVDTGAAVPVVYNNYKLPRVTRSVLSADLIEFADKFDDDFVIHSQLEQAKQCSLPMQLLTDSKFLFDTIRKGSRLSEKRIILDMHAARQVYKTKENSNIRFVVSSENIDCGLTKDKMQKVLFELLRTSKHTIN